MERHTVLTLKCPLAETSLDDCHASLVQVQDFVGPGSLHHSIVNNLS